MRSLRRQKTRVFVGAELDQIAVGIAQIDRAQSATCAASLRGRYEDRHPGGSKLRFDAVEVVDQETDVAGAGLRMDGARRKHVVGLVQIDLVRAEAQRRSLLGAEYLMCHAEHARVERDRLLDRSDRQYQMI